MACSKKIIFILVFFASMFLGSRCFAATAPQQYDVKTHSSKYCWINPLNDESGEKDFSTSQINIIRSLLVTGTNDTLKTFNFKASYSYKISAQTFLNDESSRIYINLSGISNNKVYLFYCGTISKNNTEISFTLPANFATSDVYTMLWVDNPGLFSTDADNIQFRVIEQYQDEQLNDINNSINDVNNSVKDVNDSINNSDINVDSSTLPSDNTADITANGFNSLFDKIYTTFTSGSAKDLVVNIPFTGKSFVINYNNVYGSANLGIVKTLIQAFWYFTISYFIVRDIGKKINKIKSGDIEHVEENNIKEDLL